MAVRWMSFELTVPTYTVLQQILISQNTQKHLRWWTLWWIKALMSAEHLQSIDTLNGTEISLSSPKNPSFTSCFVFCFFLHICHKCHVFLFVFFFGERWFSSHRALLSTQREFLYSHKWGWKNHQSKQTCVVTTSAQMFASGKQRIQIDRNQWLVCRRPLSGRRFTAVFSAATAPH